jgi:transposase
MEWEPKPLSGPKRRLVNRYDMEFKLYAIRLMERDGKTPTQLEQKYGISAGTFAYWRNKKDELREKSTKPPHLNYYSELSLTRRALKRAMAERDILKKAISYFAKRSPRGTSSSGRTEKKSRYHSGATHYL